MWILRAVFAVALMIASQAFPTKAATANRSPTTDTLPYYRVNVVADTIRAWGEGTGRVDASDRYPDSLSGNWIKVPDAANDTVIMRLALDSVLDIATRSWDTMGVAVFRISRSPRRSPTAIYMSVSAFNVFSRWIDSTIAQVDVHFGRSGKTDTTVTYPLALGKDIRNHAFFSVDGDQTPITKPTNREVVSIYGQNGAFLDLIKLPLDSVFVEHRLDSISVRVRRMSKAVVDGNQVGTIYGGVRVSGISVDTDFGLDVHRYAQGDSRWGSKLLNDIPGKTMGKKGCAVASGAMLLNHLGIRDLTGDTLTPGYLIDWLNENKGFTEFGDFTWGSLISFAKKSRKMNPGQPLLFHVGTSLSADSVERYLANKLPVMLRVKSQSASGHLHFVMARAMTKETDSVSDSIRGTYLLADPAIADNSLLSYGKNGGKRFSTTNRPNRFISANLFRVANPDSVDLSWIQLNLHSPAELLITDPAGRRLGYDPSADTYYNEIPGGYYEQDNRIADATDSGDDDHLSKEIYIPRTLQGRYRLKVIGTGTGSYTVTIAHGNRLADSIVHEPRIEGQTYVGKVDDAAIDINKASGNETDREAPVTFHDYAFDGIPVNAPSVTFNLHAEDLFSGVRRTIHTVDGGARIEGAVVTIAQPGRSVVRFWSEDMAGNIEMQKSVTVLLGTAPRILEHPQPKTANPGDTVGFKVRADGIPFVSYQWYKNGVEVPGGTHASLTLSGVSLGDGGNYACRVWNEIGEVSSNAASLQILGLSRPVIMRQPDSIFEAQPNAVPASRHKLSVIVTGQPAPTFQWYRAENGTAIAGATDSVIRPMANGVYFCIVKNSLGSIRSKDGVIAVNVPLITKQPRSIITELGGKGTFSLDYRADSYYEFRNSMRKWGESGPVQWEFFKQKTIEPVQKHHFGVYTWQIAMFRSLWHPAGHFEGAASSRQFTLLQGARKYQDRPSRLAMGADGKMMFFFDNDTLKAMDTAFNTLYKSASTYFSPGKITVDPSSGAVLFTSGSKLYGLIPGVGAFSSLPWSPKTFANQLDEQIALDPVAGAVAISDVIRAPHSPSDDYIGRLYLFDFRHNQILWEYEDYTYFTDKFFAHGRLYAGEKYGNVLAFNKQAALTAGTNRLAWTKMVAAEAAEVVNITTISNDPKTIYVKDYFSGSVLRALTIGSDGLPTLSPVTMPAQGFDPLVDHDGNFICSGMNDFDYLEYISSRRPDGSINWEVPAGLIRSEAVLGSGGLSGKGIVYFLASDAGTGFLSAEDPWYLRGYNLSDGTLAYEIPVGIDVNFVVGGKLDLQMTAGGKIFTSDNKHVVGIQTPSQGLLHCQPTRSFDSQNSYYSASPEDAVYHENFTMNGDLAQLGFSNVRFWSKEAGTGHVSSSSPGGWQNISTATSPLFMRRVRRDSANGFVVEWRIRFPDSWESDPSGSQWKENNKTYMTLLDAANGQPGLTVMFRPNRPSDLHYPDIILTNEQTGAADSGRTNVVTPFGTGSRAGWVHLKLLVTPSGAKVYYGENGTYRSSPIISTSRQVPMRYNKLQLGYKTGESKNYTVLIDDVVVRLNR